MPEDKCYFQGTREIEAAFLLIKVLEGILTETMVAITEQAVEVISEDEDTMVSVVAFDNQGGLFFKGSSYVLFSDYLFSSTTKELN